MSYNLYCLENEESKAQVPTVSISVNFLEYNSD